MSVASFYLTRSFKRRPAEDLKQLVFLVPTIAIPLFLILLAYLPYANQWSYLSHMQYDFCEFTNADVATEGSFLYVKSTSFAEKGDGGETAVRGVASYYFDPADSMDFECSPFAEEVVIQGKMPFELECGEAILSKNVAQSLDVSVGDAILLPGDDGLYSTAREYRLAGITMPGYSYGDIGKRWGLALACDSKEELSQTVSKAVHFAREDDSGGVAKQTGDRITLLQQKNEAASAVSQGGACLLLMIAALLILVLVMSREASHRFELARGDIAVLLALGAEKRGLLLGLAVEEFLVMACSSAFAVLLLKAVFCWRVFELTFAAGAMLFCLSLLCVLEVLIVAWFYARKKVKGAFAVASVDFERGQGR